MFDSPISKTQGQLAQAARAATDDYIQNGTDLTEAVVKAASAMQPLTSEHVRRICEMTYHDAYERMFAEKTGMHQYVTFDPPDAILAAEMLDALQLGLNNQANFDKLAMDRHQYHDEVAPMKKEASDYYVGEGKTHWGDSFLPHFERKDGYIPEEHDKYVSLGSNEFMYDLEDKRMFTDPKKFKRHMQDPTKRKNYIMTVSSLPGYSRADAMKEVKALHAMGKAASIQDDAEQAVRQTLEDASTPKGLARLIASKALKHDREGVIIKKLGLEKEASMFKEASRGAGIGALLGGGAGYVTGDSEASTKDKLQRAAVGGLAGGAAGHLVAKASGPSIKNLKKHKADLEDDVAYGKKYLDKAKKREAAQRKELKQMKKRIKQQEAEFKKEASAPSMPRKFQRMNTHEFWTKAASGKDLPDHNPTRELQQVHRDLKDSISTVKSELYSAEHNEKLAMIDMVKQAKAGLSAGHSMEQVLHAAVSVVDATEPLMAKTAHDLCATIAQACGKHQNFSKTAGILQEVNPNHPIPQKFKKLAEANIQRKHLEVTLDELNRNLDYFNEQLKDELFR